VSVRAQLWAEALVGMRDRVRGEEEEEEEEGDAHATCQGQEGLVVASVAHEG
jgi:hypothetical protein